MSNNFLQWNPAAVNQQDDATYVLDVIRTGGAITGIFTSELANKLFYEHVLLHHLLNKKHYYRI